MVNHRTTGEHRAGDPDPQVLEDSPERTNPKDLLSLQQLKVFKLLGEGMANKEIAYRLGITESTVKAHVSAILDKLECSNRTRAALLALRFQLTGECRMGAGL